MMRRSIEKPRSYPAALLTNRHLIPNFLHIVVERSRVHDIHSSKEFNYDALYKASIEAHFQRNVASSFISLYESAATASRKHPHSENIRGKPLSYDAVMVDVDTSGMMPAWISVENGVHIPVWFEEHSQESGEAHREVLWFCLEEMKQVHLMDNSLGEKGEWLACGFIPQWRVVTHSKSSSSEPPQRVFNDEEKHEADRQARRERRRIETERLQPDQRNFEHMIKKAQSSRSLKIPPRIPNRKSSLNSLVCKAISEPKKEANEGSKLSVTTRMARVSLTNADPNSAAALMKYAIMMAHGKKLEGEETWLSEATSSTGDLDRAQSMHTIEHGPSKERRNGFSGPITPPESPKSALIRQNTQQRMGHNDYDDPTLRYELTQHDDNKSSKSSKEDRGRMRRSAAPSPSQSMLGFHLGGSNGSSLRPRRSRRDLLLELQSDEDSVLREYARISLQNPTILQQQASRYRHENTNEDAESRVQQHEDSHSLISLRDRPVDSTSAPPIPANKPPPSHSTRNEAHDPPRVNPRDPSLYSAMSSLASLSTFEHADIEEVVYATVERASHAKEIDMVSSKKSPSGLGPMSSSRQSTIRRTNASRLVDVQEEADAEVESLAEPFPTFNLDAQPDQSEQEVPSPPAPALTPSKGEHFLARAKLLGEKGREITSRLAEIKDRQSKSKPKKEKWDLGIWGLGEKDGNKRIGKQDV
jgi:hypothetical protein